jgi:hypothetical protein
MTQELFDVEPNIGRDLAQQRRRDVATGVERNRRASPVWVAELLMRTTLPYFREPVLLKKLYNLARLKNWDGSHASCNLDLPHADELRL